MRSASFLLLALAGAAPLWAQEKLPILSAEQHPREMLNTFLLAEAEAL